jgi:hypothetical protein
LILQLLQFPRFHIPGFVRRRVIRELSGLTADAFKCVAPSLNDLSGKACLNEYALFTNEQATKVIQGEGGSEAVKKRLYQNAFLMGSKIRHRFHITKQRDVMLASRLIYALLDIEMQEGSGGIIISRCFFSKYYSCDVCQVISSLDEGMAAGLSGGGRLEFQQRITQGSDCCRASFSSTGEQI